MVTRRIETHLSLQTMPVVAGVLVFVFSFDNGNGLQYWLGLAFPGVVFVGVAGHLFIELLKTETPRETRKPRGADTE